MSHTFSLNKPLASVFWPKQTTLLKEVALVLAGVILLALSAHIIIPWQPVPLTFQSATVLFIGMTFGARLSAYTLLAYLIAGACGLPVLADMPSTNTFFFGQTAGYLFGFLPAAALTGYLAQRGWAAGVISSFVAACLGAVVIFTCGVTVLSQFIGWHAAITFGLMPFIITEPLKLMAFSLVAPRLWKKQS